LKYLEFTCHFTCNSFWYGNASCLIYSWSFSFLNTPGTCFLFQTNPIFISIFHPNQFLMGLWVKTLAP
jgi:hypothetical protein